MLLIEISPAAGVTEGARRTSPGVQRVSSDDFVAFCHTHHGRLVLAVEGYCGQRPLAEDVVQEALVRCAERWDHVGRLESPAAWAFRVACNLANSTFRRQRAERRAHGRLAADPRHHHDNHDGAELREALRDALATLSPRQRSAVLLRFVVGLTPDEASSVLETSPGSVRVLTHRGVARLRALLVSTPDARED